MSVYEALTLMISFTSLVMTIISSIFIVLNFQNNKK